MFDRFGLTICANCLHCLFACGCTCLQRCVGGLWLLVSGLPTLAVSLWHLWQDCVEMVCTLCTLCCHVDAYVCNAWFVDCCCLCVACQSWLSHLCIDDSFGLNLCAICIQFVGMWMHMLAKLGWWIVVACLWFVNACFFICVYFVEFGLNLCAFC